MKLHLTAIAAFVAASSVSAFAQSTAAPAAPAAPKAATAPAAPSAGKMSDAPAPKATDTKKPVKKKAAPKKAPTNAAAPKKAPTNAAAPAKPLAAANSAPPATPDKPGTYSSGPSQLKDKDGKVIPTDPKAYPIDSAMPKK